MQTRVNRESMREKKIWLYIVQAVRLSLNIGIGGSIMPKGNRMGPEGNGPGTGRGSGFCGGGVVPGYMNSRGSGWSGRSGGEGMGRGHNRPGPGFAHKHHAGYGIGAGMKNGFRGNPGKSEKELIDGEVAFLEEQLKTLESRLEKLKDE